jgi:CheY-like chemotaxis protein
MKKILIVEDELVVRSIYRRKFEMSGYEVETAEEGAAALKLLPIFKPDVIQVDIMMPGMDGVEVIRQIRAWPEFRHVPILVLSSFYRPDLAKEAWKAGASKCVSKMDCTPNLVLELVEQLLSGENSGFTPKLASMPLPDGPSEQTRPSQGQDTSADDGTKLKLKQDVSPSKLANPSRPSPSLAEPAPIGQEEPTTQGLPKLSLDLNLPPSKGTAPSRPTFGKENEGAASPKQPTRPTFASSTPKTSPDDRAEPLAPDPSAPATSEPSPSAPGSAPDFRIEVRQDFLKRVPQIQAELRERVGALIKSKSPSEQLKLLKELEVSVSSLASLAGITGFSRVSHLSGALDALIKELNKKPSQMTSSVLRSIAHAMDCLNVLFRDLTQFPQDIPDSMLILAVDDEPISRRTISVALGKANLRCISLEDSKMALTILQENAFDLIFLDAEMPGLNGFELCSELRKMPTNKTTPVIFVTSLTKFETRAQSSLSGGNDLIAKPFLMMELAVKALTYLLKPPLSAEARISPAQPAE